MADRGNVIKEFEAGIQDFSPADTSDERFKEVCNAVLALLKAQEPVKWVKISPAGIYECSGCGQNVMTSDIDAYKYCHGCGRVVERNG